VGDLGNFDIFHNQILVVTYVRPEKTAGGIIRPGVNVQEDEYQGKVGLVVKVGPTAFLDTEDEDFQGQNVEVGDWVVFRVGDGWQLTIRDTACRILSDRTIRMRIKNREIFINARIRPLRTKEEIAAVPQDESVTIALEPEGTVILDKEADEAAIKAREEAEERTKAKIRPDPEEDATADLKKQLEDLRKANEESQRRLQENITARQAAEQRVHEREQDAARSQVRAEDAEYDAILNAIGAAESEAEAAQRDISLATEASDAKAVGEASRRLARAEGRLAQLEDGKLAIERAKTEEAARAKERPQQQQGNTQAQPTIEQYIDQLPNLLPSQRDWLKAHPESLTDPRKNQRLQGAHVEAEDNGLRPAHRNISIILRSDLDIRSQTKRMMM